MSAPWRSRNAGKWPSFNAASVASGLVAAELQGEAPVGVRAPLLEAERDARALDWRARGVDHDADQLIGAARGARENDLEALHGLLGGRPHVVGEARGRGQQESPRRAEGGELEVALVVGDGSRVRHAQALDRVRQQRVVAALHPDDELGSTDARAALVADATPDAHARRDDERHRVRGEASSLENKRAASGSKTAIQLGSSTARWPKIIGASCSVDVRALPEDLPFDRELEAAIGARDGLGARARASECEPGAGWPALGGK